MKRSPKQRLEDRRERIALNKTARAIDKAQHTPSPWIEFRSGLWTKNEINNGKKLRITEFDGYHTIAEVNDVSLAEANRIATYDREFIVRAVNSHDIMLETLRRIVASAPLTGLPLAFEKDIQSACATITIAEGK